MNKKSITIDIDEMGNISIEGNNFVGAECSHFIKEISDELGKTTNSSRKKEYNIKTVFKQKEKN